MSAAFDPFSSSVQAGSSVLDIISKVGSQIQTLSDVGRQKTLIELSSPARVEPSTFVSADCVNVEFIGDVMQSLQSIFTGYYLQAVNLVCSMQTAKTVRNLERLNPHRNLNLAYRGEEGGLGQLGAESIVNRWKISYENIDDKNKPSKSRSQVEYKNIDVVKENANLSVGKLVEVTVTEGESTVKIPMAFRLMVSTLPDNVASQILTINVQDNSFLERWHGWRSGRLSFLKDLVMCQDLIDQHKKAMIKDKSGIYRDIIASANKNKLAAMFDGKGRQSLNSASNLFVISEATAAEIEERGNGKLSNRVFREKVMASGYAMILVVIDRQYDRVRFYHRGIDQSTSVGKNDMKSANKGTGIDVQDVMKMFIQGSSPSF